MVALRINPSGMHLTTCCSMLICVIFTLFGIEWGYLSEWWEILMINKASMMDLWIDPSRMHLTTCCSIPKANKWEFNLVLSWSRGIVVNNWRLDCSLTLNGFKQVGTIFGGFPPNFHFQHLISHTMWIESANSFYNMYIHCLW